MKVIGLVGKAGAGKDMVCEIMEKRHPSLRMGDVVIEETRRRGLEITDENVGMVASDLRKKEGMAAIAKRCVEKIESLDSPIVIINGIRGSDEVKFFQTMFEHFLVIEVWAPDSVRYERIRKRSRADDVQDFEQFLERDRRETSWGLEQAISMAAYKIVNDGTLDVLDTRTCELMSRIESDC